MANQRLNRNLGLPGVEDNFEEKLMQLMESMGATRTQSPGGQQRDPLAAVPDPSDPNFLGTARPDPSGVFNVRPDPMGMEGHDHAKMLRDQAAMDMDMPSSPPMSSSRSFSSSTTGMDVAKNLIDPLMQHDFSTDLMVNPERIKPKILADRKAAYEAADAPYEASTFDKIAKYGGLAALVLGGTVGRKNPEWAGPLGTLAGAGLSYAGGAPGRHRADLDRTLRNELGATQADVLQYDLDNSARQDLNALGETRGKFLLRAAGLVQRGRESERMAGMGGGGSYPKFSFEQMLTDAIRNQDFRALSQINELYKGKSLGEQMKQAYNDLKDLKYQSVSLGGGMRLPAWMMPRGDDGGGIDPSKLLDIGTVPSTSDVQRAEKDLESLRAEQADIIGEEVEAFPTDVIDLSDWPLNSKRYLTAPRDSSVLGDISSRALSGDLMTPKTIEQPWYRPNTDTTVANTRLSAAADSLGGLMGVNTDSLMRLNPELYDKHSAQTGARRNIFEALGFGVPKAPSFEESGFRDPAQYESFLKQWPNHWQGLSPEEQAKYRQTGAF